MEQKQSEQKPLPPLRARLKDFLARYYSICDLRPVEAGKVLEVYAPDADCPQSELVFDRKTLQDCPRAELVTFNSPWLKDILTQVGERGRIAKGFIPFSHDPQKDFAIALHNLVSFGAPRKQTQNYSTPPNNYLLNGTVALEGHQLTYAPFLTFVIRTTFESLEPQELVEMVVLPIVDSKVVSQDTLSPLVEKIKQYLAGPAPAIVDQMPCKGTLLEFTKEQVRGSLSQVMVIIRDFISTKRQVVEGRLKERMQKELDIIARYYETQKQDMADKLAKDGGKEEAAPRSANASRKKKKAPVKEEDARLQDIGGEFEAKRKECESLYAVTVDYDVLGAAAIYVPLDFRYTAQLTTPRAIRSQDFAYDVFVGALTPPTCPACGEPVHQGYLDASNHLSCVACHRTCGECHREMCLACEMHQCDVCQKSFCKDHSHPCERVKKKSKTHSGWACAAHSGPCQICGKSICDTCATSCAICRRRVCKDDRACSRACHVCGSTLCHDHGYACPACGKMACPTHVQTCVACHQTYCTSHFSEGYKACSTCRNASWRDFDKFLRSDGADFNPPPEMGRKYSDAKRKEKQGIGTRVKTLPLIYMNSNRTFFIFRINSTWENFVVVVDKNTGRQTLFRNLNTMGRVRKFLTKKELPSKYELDAPAVTGPDIPPFTSPAWDIPVKAGRQSGDASLVTCPKCKKAVDAKFKHCPNCGTKLNPDAEE